MIPWSSKTPGFMSWPASADRLEKAQKEIKVLRGFIPICASCKKSAMMKATGSRWNHISNHSEALFTHSLCPDCLEKWYPEGKTRKKKASPVKKPTAKKKTAVKKNK